MSRLAAFGRFWWNFVVGDDWLVAAEIVVAVGATAALAKNSIGAWWLLRLVVIVVLYTSLRRATRPKPACAAQALIGPPVPTVRHWPGPMPARAYGGAR
jgi:hypothetical protein